MPIGTHTYTYKCKNNNYIFGGGGGNLVLKKV